MFDPSKFETKSSIRCIKEAIRAVTDNIENPEEKEKVKLDILNEWNTHGKINISEVGPWRTIDKCITNGHPVKVELVSVGPKKKLVETGEKIIASSAMPSKVFRNNFVAIPVEKLIDMADEDVLEQISSGTPVRAEDVKDAVDIVVETTGAAPQEVKEAIQENAIAIKGMAKELTNEVKENLKGTGVNENIVPPAVLQQSTEHPVVNSSVSTPSNNTVPSTPPPVSLPAEEKGWFKKYWELVCGKDGSDWYNSEHGGWKRAAAIGIPIVALTTAITVAVMYNKKKKKQQLEEDERNEDMPDNFSRTRILPYYAYNFAKHEHKVCEVVAPVISRVKKHWFIRSKGFHMESIYHDRAIFCTWGEDKGHAYASKWALYFDLVGQNGDVKHCFVGFQNDGVGFYLGTGYDFGDAFDYGEFAQRFYVNIDQVRAKYRDFLPFAKWMMNQKNAASLLRGSIAGLDTEYDIANVNPWNFFTKRGTQSLEYLFGSYSEPELLDTNIPMEIIGSQLEYFDNSDLTGLIFDYEGIIKSLEEALLKVEYGKTSAIKSFPETSFNDNEEKIYHIHKNEAVEVGSSAQATGHVGLNNLPAYWDANFLEGL